MTAIGLPESVTLVAGGGGFIGRAVVRALRKYSDRVVVVVGRSAAPAEPLDEGVIYFSGDIGDPAFIGPIIERTAEVIDLVYGTTPKTSFDDPVMDVLLNLPSSVTLQRLASERKVQRYLLVSSGGTVYGNPQYLPIGENHPNNPISPYGISKLVTEKYANFFFRTTGLPAIIARPGNAYGPGQFGIRPQGFIGVTMHAVMHGLDVVVYGERGTVRDYIYVDDLARALVLLLDGGTPGETYNIGSGKGHDNLDVLDVVRGLAGKHHPIRVLHQPPRPFDVRANVLDATRLTAATGWRPEIALAQGIEMTWKNLTENTQ